MDEPINARHQPPRIVVDGVLEEIIEVAEVSDEAWMTAFTASVARV